MRENREETKKTTLLTKKADTDNYYCSGRLSVSITVKNNGYENNSGKQLCILLFTESW